MPKCKSYAADPPCFDGNGNTATLPTKADAGYVFQSPDPGSADSEFVWDSVAHYLLPNRELGGDRLRARVYGGITEADLINEIKAWPSLRSRRTCLMMTRHSSTGSLRAILRILPP